MSGCFACIPFWKKTKDGTHHGSENDQKIIFLNVSSETQDGIPGSPKSRRMMPERHREKDHGDSSVGNHSHAKVSFYDAENGFNGRPLSRLPSTENSRTHSRPPSLQIEKHVSFQNNSTIHSQQTSPPGNLVAVRPGLLMLDLELDEIERPSRRRSPQRSALRPSPERPALRHSPELSPAAPPKSPPGSLRSTPGHPAGGPSGPGRASPRRSLEPSRTSSSASRLSAEPPSPAAPRPGGGRLTPELVVGEAVDTLAAAVRTALSGLRGAEAEAGGPPSGGGGGGGGGGGPPRYETREGAGKGDPLYLL